MGPEYVCYCCKQTWFRHSVFRADVLKDSSLIDLCLNKIKSVGNIEWVCKECKVCLNANKIPPFSQINGIEFPTIPPELELTALEERLVTPRLLFMQIRQKARGGQLSLKGNVVNVPTDVNSTIKKLPRTLTNDETILVKLKRDTNMKHWVQFQPVRPAKVLQAAKWLIANSDLFKNEGICLDENWLSESVSSVENESDSDYENENNSENIEKSTRLKDRDTVQTESDNFSENEEMNNRPSGNMDTVMQPVDFREFNQILSIAPGEGNTPVGLFQDINSEFLAFPTIYCGKTRQDDNNTRKVPLHYSSICKWELRHVDRRVSKCIPNLFYKMKRLQVKQIKDKVSLAIRKCKTKGKRITVGDILSPGGVQNIMKLDEGYRVLRTLRGSPPYWEQAKKDIFAMIRQIGIPTWFISLSAAETRWPALLKILGKLCENKEYSDEEVDAFSWEEKCKLIRSDAVSCVRYFDYRGQQFMTVILNSDLSPIGNISDFFQRIEFQQRGSPHIHMLVWVEGAPIYGVNADEEVISFLDKYVSCNKDVEIPNLINYQTHRHARTCRKKGKAICRFGFPMPPMPKTMILRPLNDDEISEQVKTNYAKISQCLDEMKYGDDIPFHEFLDQFGFDLETYILAIRSSIKADKIFLKRDPSEIRINNYNQIMLRSWEANLDIQYILDPYACAAYIVSYISKGQRGMSNLLYEACKEARKENSDIRQQVRRVGNQFLNHQEVGAQEAAYIVLQLPLRRCSRSIKFINTSNEENRTVLLKSIPDMEQMPKNSADIETDNDIKRYQRRQKCLEFCCLADFVAWFDVKNANSREERFPKASDYLPEKDYVENLDDDVETVVGSADGSANDDEVYTYRDVEGSLDSIPPGAEIVMKNGVSFIKRQKQKVIRYVRYNIEVDRDDHFRELLMLFHPWRKEENIIGSSRTFELQYDRVKNSVNDRRQHYEKSVSLENFHLSDNMDDGNMYDDVAPSTEHEDAIDRAIPDDISELYGCFDPGDNSQILSDLGLDIGLDSYRKQYFGPELVSGEMSDFSYRTCVQNLNREQRVFFDHVFHLVKTQDEPFYYFLSGGGGVGKSVVTRALYQALLKFFIHQIGENPDELKLLLCAPTGKAAYNINGNTLHSTFCIPVGQGLVYKPLAMQQLSSMQIKLSSLKVLFIDEISMVGCRMLNFINLRLQEVKGSTKPFGGVSILAIGDLFQLKPILDKWVFDDLDTDYGPIASNLWHDLFTMFELHQIMRQKDDSVFSEILNRFREGNQTPCDMTALYSRVTEEKNIPKHLPHLFTTRAEANTYNLKIYSAIEPSLKTVVLAIDTVTGDLTDKVRETIKSKIPNDSSKTMGLSKELPLAVGVSAEICINIDVEDGLTNGTPGVVKKLDFRISGSARCSIVWMEFDDSKVGQKMRTKYKHLYNEEIEGNWTPIMEVTKKFMYMYYKPYYVVRRQFPVHLAAARTIHKAQGATYEGAVVHFGARKTDHIHYVGLSRVKDLSKLYILELNENKISVSHHVQQEVDRLRSIPFSTCIQSLDKLDSGEIKIIFHNARSLHKHFDDVKNDYNLIAADILAIAETRISPNDPDNMYQLEHFRPPLRFDDDTSGTNIRSNYGIAIYAKKSVQDVKKCHAYGCDIMMCNTYLENEKFIQICFLYCRPKAATYQNLKKIFSLIFSGHLDQSLPVIIMGDFNYDSMKCKKLQDWVSKTYSCSQLIKSCTTDYMSCLDHVYTNVQNLRNVNFGTLESYFSDHKPVYLALKME